MTKLLQFDGETPILIQAPATPDDVAPISRAGDVVQKINESMAGVLGIVSGIAHDFSAALADAPVESAELEFGLQVTAKGKLYVVESEAQGAIRVQLTLNPAKVSHPTAR
jgi:hypothetical protein